MEKFKVTIVVGYPINKEIVYEKVFAENKKAAFEKIKLIWKNNGYAHLVESGYAE